MRLMLLRHAKSEKGEAGMNDRERRLSERGRGDASKIGAYLVHHELMPEHVLVSPARRTRETWERIAKAFPATSPVVFDDRLYESGSDSLIAIVRESKPSFRALLVVGHNPGLHDAARLLIASGDVEARERLNEGLPTAGLAVIDFAGSDWSKVHPHGGRLERFVTPRLLRAATD